MEWLTGSPSHRPFPPRDDPQWNKKPVDPCAERVPSAALAKAKLKTTSRQFDHRLRDNDIICLFQPLRGVYWKCEEVTLGSGSAIKIRACSVELGLRQGHKFEVIMAPPHEPVDGAEQRPRFALKSVANGRLLSPNFRGRFHVDVERDDVKETVVNNAFEAANSPYVV